jgi:hypothetical protein
MIWITNEVCLKQIWKEVPRSGTKQRLDYLLWLSTRAGLTVSKLVILLDVAADASRLPVTSLSFLCLSVDIPRRTCSFKSFLGPDRYLLKAAASLPVAPSRCGRHYKTFLALLSRPRSPSLGRPHCCEFTCHPFVLVRTPLEDFPGSRTTGSLPQPGSLGLVVDAHCELSSTPSLRTIVTSFSSFSTFSPRRLLRVLLLVFTCLLLVLMLNDHIG